MNLHFDEKRGKTLDDVYNCTKDRQGTGQLDMQCTSVSEALMPIAGPAEKEGPGALITHPIYPALDPTKVSAVMYSLVAVKIVQVSYSKRFCSWCAAHGFCDELHLVERQSRRCVSRRCNRPRLCSLYRY